jgi:hypothetical protein
MSPAAITVVGENETAFDVTPHVAPGCHHGGSRARPRDPTWKRRCRRDGHRERGAHVGVPEDLLSALRRDARLGHQRAGHVAQVMEAQRRPNPQAKMGHL